MTVTVALVQAANRRLTTAEATAALSTYSAVAQARLNNDDPGLSTTLYDWCHALMVCHLLAASAPEAGLRGHTSGDYSEQRTPGTTTWSLQYRETIARYAAAQAVSADTGLEEAVRSDAVMPGLSLDQDGGGDSPW
jgi:hypothetical protein